MSGLAGRLRRAALAGRPRPGVGLVRVDPAEPFSPVPSPLPLRALPAPEHPICPRCRTRHEPRPHPATGGGLSAVYGRTILGWPDNGRPQPLGHTADADVSSLVRDSAAAWAWGGRRPLLPYPEQREQ